MLLLHLLHLVFIELQSVLFLLKFALQTILIVDQLRNRCMQGLD